MTAVTPSVEPSGMRPAPHLPPQAAAHDHGHAHTRNPSARHISRRVLHGRSVLAWPAWLRVAAVVPLVSLLWLAVGWANGWVWPW